MPSSNKYQGLVKLGVSLITISFTFGLNCSQCMNMRNIQILKNTINGLNIVVDSWKLPRSLLCESAKNGETVDGVSVVECQNSSSGSSKEFRCVHYNGILDMSINLDQGITSGEIKIRFEGTYRDCILEYVSSGGSCTNQNFTVPIESKLSLVALSSLKSLIDTNNAIVDFNGTKCVSNVNGNFDTARITESNATMTESSILVLVLFFFICQVV